MTAESAKRLQETIARAAWNKTYTRHADGAEEERLRKRGQAALVDSRLDIAVSNTFEIDHRRSNIAVPHPLLQCADVDSVLEMPGGVGVAKFVEEPSSTVRSSRAAIDLHCFPIF